MTPIRFVTLFLAFVSLCCAQLLPQQESTEYIIFAKRGTTKADADGFGNALRALVGEAEINSILDGNGVPVVWRTQLRPDQLDKVKADRVISSVAPNKRIPLDSIPDAVDTNPDIDPELGPAPFEAATVAKRANYQQIPTPKNRLLDLRTLSTPPQANRVSPNFYYEDPAGEGITIYHIDVGPFHLDHDEFATASGATRRTIDVNQDKTDSDENADHGTCAASKIVGRTTGTAKRSNLVAIRIDLNGWGVISGFKAAAADISKNKLQGKAVVSISIGLTADDPDVLSWVRDEIEEVLLMDVPVVCASGNNGMAGEVVYVDSLPAILADELPLIVVGSANRRLEKSWFSQQGRMVTTWAVGDRVRCANFKNLAELESNSGTSFAAPQVAGIAAYFMSHPDFNAGLRKGKVAADMRDLIGATSFPRIRESGYPHIAWNLWGSQQACSPNPASTRRTSRRGAVESRALPACSAAP